MAPSLQRERERPLLDDYHAALVAWWHNLERCMMAVDDLGCRELLD